MKSTSLYEQLLSLRAPWSVRMVKLSHDAPRVTVYLNLKSGQAWPDPTNGAWAKVVGWVDREWRHLDSCHFETVIKATLPQLQYSTGVVEELEVPWADKYARTSRSLNQLVHRLLELSPSISKVNDIIRLNWRRKETDLDVHV